MTPSPAKRGRAGEGAGPAFKTSLLAEKRTVRLVASARLRPPVLEKLVARPRLAALAEIEGATSGRRIAEARGADAIAAGEFVHGVAQAAFVNAAFAYWRPRALNRFNGPGRGAWYAALAVETCVAEVAFHITRELAAVNDFDATVDYAELFASFAGAFVDLRAVKPRPACLDPDPAVGYPAGNALAESARARGLNGIVWPSVRHAGGTCLAALFPHTVQSVAQGRVLRLAWRGQREPAVSTLAGGK